jgi:aromatic ring-cleaving dioxygenase
MADDASYHAHIYAEGDERSAAITLQALYAAMPEALFVGRLTDGKSGPHPIPQFEVHFLERDLDIIVQTIEKSGLRALVHPLTDDDMADHTELGTWYGEPIVLDLTTLDPPGVNQGVARFGKSDF